MKELKKKKPKIKMAPKADQETYEALYRARDKAIESLIAVWRPYVANGHRGHEVDTACDILSKVHDKMTDKYIEIMCLRGLL